MGTIAPALASGETLANARDTTAIYTDPSAWTNPAQDDANVAWSRGMWRLCNISRRAASTSIFLGVGDGSYVSVKAAYAPKYVWLGQIKVSYDPTNLSHFNHNIAPAD